MSKESLKKYITPEGAEALRVLARSIPAAIDTISESLNNLKQKFESVKEEFGTENHQEDFMSLIASVETAINESSEAIEEIPKRLENTAKIIDEIVAKRYSNNK